MTVTEPADGDPVVVTVDPATTAVVRGTVSLDEIREGVRRLAALVPVSV